MANTDQAFSVVNDKGQTYYLHSKDVTLKNGRVQTIYFFARDVREGFLTEIPEGKEYIISAKAGLPILRNKKTK